MSIYEFRREDAYRFADFVGAKAKTVRGGKELQFTECPYCHSRKDKNTFSINLISGAFTCLRASCNAKGNMLTLHRDFNFDLGADLSEYERELSTWRRYRKPPEKEPNNAVIDYLYKQRGIEPEIIAKYGIRTKKDQPNVIAFPFIGATGYMEFIKYRKTDFNPDKDKNKEWCEPNMRPILFGMEQCNTENSTLIITEGQIDSLTVASCGYENAVSVPTGKKGFTWIPHCWDWLHKFTEIIVFGDCEHGEITLLADIKSRFEWMSVKAVRKECYKDCKDANELYRKYGKDAIREAIETATAELPERIKRIQDISDEDDASVEKLPIGIEKIDNMLNGGLPFGAFNILTGKRGEGKSTEASMIVKSAIANGYTTFIYSGELDTRVQKRWLDLQIAGRDHIEIKDIDHQRFCQISKPNREIIRNYYRDMVYMYDTSVITDEANDLIPTIKKCIVQFGCRVILIDNLMTAIDIFDGQGGEKGDRQERLCKTLARMAMEYDVLILLIAHKKKQQKDFVSDENDAVLGSSEITNLADAVLSYERPKEKDIDNGLYTDSQRIIKLTKNRSGNGRVDFKGAVCEFCEISKRIYSTGSKFQDTPTLPEKCFMNNDGFTDSMDNPFD